MKRLLAALPLLLAFLMAAPAHAQYTTVSAQVKDPTGANWANCTVNLSYVPSPTATTQALLSGSTFQTAIPAVRCDSFGRFIVNTPGVADNNQIQDGHTGPVGSQWAINVRSDNLCFPGQIFAFTATTTITGGTQDLTSFLQANAPVLPNCGGGGTGIGCGSGVAFTVPSVPYTPTSSTCASTAFNYYADGATGSSGLCGNLSHPTIFTQFLPYDTCWTATNASFDNTNGTRNSSGTPLSSCWTAGDGSSPSVSCSINITANTVIVAGSWNYGGTAVTPIQDTFGLTWHTLTSCEAFRAGSRNDFQTIYYADTGANAGSDTITTNNISSNFAIIEAADFNTGIATPIPDATFTCAGGTSGGAGIVSSNAASLSQANELVVGLGESNSNPGTFLAGPGFSFSITSGPPNYGSASFIGSLITPMEATVQPSSGSFQASFTQTTGAFWFAMGVSFPSTATVTTPIGSTVNANGFSTGNESGGVVVCPDGILLAGSLDLCANIGGSNYDWLQQVIAANEYEIGQVGGTGALFIDNAGNITVHGCTGCGAGFTGLTTQGMLYANSSTTGTSLTPPSTNNGQYNCGYTVTANAAVPPTCYQIGLASRAVTGTTDTVLYTDNNETVEYQGASAVAVAVPTPTSLQNTHFFTRVENLTTGTSTNVTVTPTTWTVNGGATLTIGQQVSCRLGVNPNVANDWLAACNPLGSAGVAGTQTIASGTAAMGTGAITSGTCATAVTVGATGVATTDAIIATPNGDPTGITGYVPSTTGTLYIWAYPTANNVNFKVCNNTSASVTPSALTLNWRVVR